MLLPLLDARICIVITINTMGKKRGTYLIDAFPTDQALHRALDWIEDRRRSWESQIHQLSLGTHLQILLANVQEHLEPWWMMQLQRRTWQQELLLVIGPGLRFCIEDWLGCSRIDRRFSLSTSE